MNERLEAVMSGRVQMVMYRDFAQRNATALGLTGEVTNLPDGTVRVIAEGTRPRLEKLIVQLRKGSLFSRVDDVSVTWGSAEGKYKDFSIVYE